MRNRDKKAEIGGGRVGRKAPRCSDQRMPRVRVAGWLLGSGVLADGVVREVVTEVVGDGDGIADDLLRSVVGRSLAALDEIAAIRDGQGLGRLMVGDEDADALVAQLANDVL